MQLLQTRPLQIPQYIFPSGAHAAAGRQQCDGTSDDRFRQYVHQFAKDLAAFGNARQEQAAREKNKAT